MRSSTTLDSNNYIYIYISRFLRMLSMEVVATFMLYNLLTSALLIINKRVDIVYN